MSTPSARELVFCHECDNEWYRDEGGLTCPGCHSDFVEVIEEAHDPRTSEYPSHSEAQDHPFATHNPWETSNRPTSATDDAPDPDEDDIDDVGPQFSTGRRGPGREQQTPRTGPQPYNAILGDFASMFYHVLGGPGGVHSNESFGGPSPFIPPHSAGPFSGGSSFTHTSSRSMPGTGTHYQFSYSSSHGGRTTIFGGDPTTGRTVDNTDMHEFLAGFLGRGGPQGGPSNWGDLLGSILTGGLNGVNPGDFVHSDRRMEDVMTHLMDHSRGNAPQAASDAAIESLPKQAATKELLGGEESGSCPVCMDDVGIGEEVQVLPCSHWFHPQCSSLWLRQHDTCPICRAGITPKDGDRSRARSSRQEPLNDDDPVRVRERQEMQRRESFQNPPSGIRHLGTGVYDPNIRHDGGSGDSNDNDNNDNNNSNNNGGRSGFTTWFSGGPSTQERH